MGDESQVTKDEEMSSGIPALDQTSSRKCHESKGLTINNGPEAKDEDSNDKKQEKDNKVKEKKIKKKDSKKRQCSTSGSSSSSGISRLEDENSSLDSSEKERIPQVFHKSRRINEN